MTLKLHRFDMSEWLDGSEPVAEYLTQVLADADDEEFIRALSYAARGKGMASIAKVSGLGRAGLRKALAPGATPRLDEVLSVIRALGVRLRADVA
jgi:probable addiction module antidote protein